MISKDTLTEAFDLLISAMNQYIQKLNHQGGEMFTKGNYSKVEDIKDKAERITTLVDQLKTIETQWIQLFPHLDRTVKPIPKIGSRIVVLVTKGGLTHSYLGVGKHQKFFPSDSFGSSNKSKGMGKALCLHVAGIEKDIMTDIVRDKMFFRQRAWCGQFFKIHGLKAGDKIIIEKINEYEFIVFPSILSFDKLSE